jgi:hypothetical protein
MIFSLQPGNSLTLRTQYKSDHPKGELHPGGWADCRPNHSSRRGTYVRSDGRGKPCSLCWGILTLLCSTARLNCLGDPAINRIAHLGQTPVR